jgi:hypothetical protein
MRGGGSTNKSTELEGSTKTSDQIGAKFKEVETN